MVRPPLFGLDPFRFPCVPPPPPGRAGGPKSGCSQSMHFGHRPNVDCLDSDQWLEMWTICRLQKQISAGWLVWLVLAQFACKNQAYILLAVMSLAAQLRAIGGSLDADRLTAQASRTQPSYLFSPRQAATQSIADVYALGHNGYLALLAKSPGLAPMESILFSDQAKQTDRTMLSREANARLNEELGRALRILSSNILLRPCGQVLEWLIRRFRCASFNLTGCLNCDMSAQSA